MKIRFGVFADLHTDFMHDTEQRVEQFLTECKEEQVDFAIQLGDFCPPNGVHMEAKKTILEMIEKSGIPFYHLIGNHDVDANTKTEVVEYLVEKDRHYSFDRKQMHFVVLDANFFKKDRQYYAYDRGNYRGLPSSVKMPVIPPKELEWLANDLKHAKYPTVVFTHQSLIESRAGIRNAESLRKVFREAPNGVLMAVCGHEHVDRLEKKEDTWYYCLNSISYYWAGGKYTHDTYDKELAEKYPKLEKVFPYEEPLYAIIEITDKEIVIKGRTSKIVGATPEELCFEKRGLVDQITAGITDRKILIGE